MQWLTVALAWLSGMSQFWYIVDNLLPLPSLCNAPTGPQEATVFSLVYGRPCDSYSNLALKIAQGLGTFTTNGFLHQKELANSNFTDINRPNVDTLYSEAVIDLSTYDVVAHLPSVPAGRFYVYPFYDVYGNNFVNLGTMNNTAQGKYLITYRPSDPGYGPGDDTYNGYIFMPTPYGAIDLRIEVFNSCDVKNVRELQIHFKLATTNATRREKIPQLTNALLCDGLAVEKSYRLLQLTARIAEFNPPEVKEDIICVKDTLALAGLEHGVYKTPPGVDLVTAAGEAALTVAAVSKSEKNFLDLGNAWSTFCPNLTGDFKSHFDIRAFVAAEGYLQLQYNEAIYPFFNLSTPLLTNTTYNVTFYGKPQVDGFWSLTLYTNKAFLIPNPLNRYSLGDRSNFTYPDGSHVYGPDGSCPTSTVPFSLYLQTQDVPPPQQYYWNWLPTPSSNETSFNMNLRWYGPTDDLENNYTYPTVEIIDILKGSY